MLSRSNEGRGTHPGDTEAALDVHRPNLDRSTKAGARTPATRVTPLWRAVPTPLNEGRGTHPGDTRLLQFPAHCARQRRSTKAGARTPATLAQSYVRFAVPFRSTKAGARTPATRPMGGRARRWGSTLNEGRGTHPGDTCIPPGSPLPFGPSIAQRRPGHAPRRHSGITAPMWRQIFTAQRRPGHAPRRHSPVLWRARPS